MMKIPPLKSLIIAFIILLSTSTAHGNGCSLQTSTDVLYEVQCDGELDNLRTLIPQYVTTNDLVYDDENHYYRMDQHLNERKIILNVINIDIDKYWDVDYQYMNENIQKITINQVNTVPNRITDFANIEEVINGYGNVLSEMNLNVFLGLTQISEIRFNHSFIENIISVHNYLETSRTSHVYLIDLSHNSIQTLPNSCFANFPHLTNLNLSYNLIQNINILTFEGLQNLETFDISFNRIKEIGHSFIRFVSVKNMYLNNNNLNKIIEPNFVTMNVLERLNVSSNMLNFIEENSFQNLKNIEELDLSNNNLTRITKGMLQNSTKLNKISFANNPIQKIESYAFHGQNITYFDIDGVYLIGSIEKRSFIGIFKEHFNLSHGKLDSLEPEAFTELHTIVLDLSYNKLNNISATSFTGVKLIKELDLSNNNLNCIEFDTSDLKPLQILHAQNNCISKISKSSFDNLVSLKKLILSYNNLSELEPGIFSNLNKLEFFDISYNYLANSLQANYFHGLSSVKNVQLMFNKFTTIQNNTFEGLKSLEILNCSHGEISSIDYKAFENTGSLKIIDFSYNSLQDFIVNSTSIESLKELHLNDNEINSVEGQMPKLEKLNLANNNLAKIKANLFASSKNFTALDLSANNGIEFEDIFENLSNLSELALRNIGKQFNFQHFSELSISRLDLSLNNIKNISSIFIYKIKDITFLNLKSNKITIIDKSSFRNMPELRSLDLSFNLINFLQPGSFLQLNALQTLNLHGNFIQALQFGVLDGLNNLETLNLSSNSIHEFRITLLHTSLAIKTLALDDNVIENFKFEEFLSSEIQTITIGGNPLSCHTIADFKRRKDVFTITAEILDYHTENIDGIKCLTNFIIKKNSTLLQNNSDVHETASFWIMSKAIDNFRASVENLRQSFDKISLNDSYTKKDEMQLQKKYNSFVNNSDFNSLFRNIASIERLMHNLTNILSQGSTKQDQQFVNKLEEKSINFNLQEKINVLNEEKEKMIKELHNHFDNLKQGKFMKSVSDINNSDDNREFKAIMYFIAVCLTICVMVIIYFLIFKLFQKYKRFQTDGYRCSSSQPINNVIELQDN